MADVVMSVMRWVDAAFGLGVRLQGGRSRYVQTEEARVHVVEVRGRGPLPPILMFHGLASQGGDYVPLFRPLRRLAKRLIAPDMPGHGQSELPGGEIDPARMEAALMAALDEVVQEPVIVFGNSMGGLVAIRYAQARPERVRALILASPGGTPMDAETLKPFWDRFKLRTHDEALGFVDKLLGRASALRHFIALGVRYRMGLPLVRKLMDETTPDELLVPEDLQQITAPTLLFWGRGDGVLPETHLEFFKRHLPDHAVIETPEGYGHSPHVDNVRGFVRSIRRFLRRVFDERDAAGGDATSAR